MVEEPKMWDELFRVAVPHSRKLGGHPMLMVPELGDDLIIPGNRVFLEMVIEIFDSEAKKRGLTDGQRKKIKEVSDAIRMGFKTKE